MSNRPIEKSQTPHPVEVIPDIDSLKLGRKIASGGNTDVYDVEGNPELIGRMFRSHWEGNLPMIADLMEKMKEIPEIVNIARILSVGTKNGFAFALMERAPGKAVHNRHGNYDQWHDAIVRLSLIPLEQYQKLIQDDQELFRHGLTIDPSKPDNLFYDDQHGFTFIDLGEMASDQAKPYFLLPSLIDVGAIYNRLRGKLKSEDLDNLEKIMARLRLAGDNFDEHRLEEIHRVVQEIE